MKFGNLLAAGKSLVNGDMSGRYQMEKNFRLPQFISPRNPFLRETVAQPATPPPVVAPVVAPAVPAVSAPLTPAPAALPQVQAAANVAPPAAKISLAARVGSGVQKFLLFCLDHNPFSAIGRPQLAGIPRFGKPAVQGELTLDRVKVVRNDLTHADLEVVQSGSK
jgi:hypothetical protein